MCYGGADTNPVHVSAYLKNEAGWTSKLTTLAAGSSFPVSAGTNDFLLHAKNSTEYFIIENRQQTGRDAALPDAGLLIWHVDENGSNNNEQMTPAQHYELSLDQADNRFRPRARRQPGRQQRPATGRRANQAFGDATTPNSKWWDGTAVGTRHRRRVGSGRGRHGQDERRRTNARGEQLRLQRRQLARQPASSFRRRHDR